MSFVAELKRRNVIRVALVYLAAAWLIIQVADTLFPVLSVPEWSMRLIVGLLALGFPIAVVLAWAFDLTPDGVRRDSSGEQQHASVDSKRRLDFLIIGILSAAVTFMVIDNYILVGEPLVIDTNAVAVLPMDMIGGDESNLFLADGMTATLINELSKIESLRVISRTSVQRYVDSGLSLPEIASALNVGAIIEGTVIKSGDQVRITASLVPAEADAASWSQEFDRDIGDVLAMHSEIARAIATNVRIELSEADEARLEAPAASTADVQLKLLEGRYLQNRGDLLQGRALIEEAVREAPDYAQAWAELARTYLRFTNEDPQYLPDAIRAAEKALELDPNLSDAHRVVGSIALYREWDWEKALTSLNRAIALNPGNEEALQALGDYYESIGDWDRAIVLGIESIRSSPTDPSMYMNLGLTYNYAMLPDKGLEACITGARHGDYAWLAACRAESYLFLGDSEAALREIDSVIAGAGDDQTVIALTMVYLGMLGETERVAELLEDLQRRSETQFVSPLYLAYGHFGIGDYDGFFEYLNKAVDQKAMFTQWSAQIPHFRALWDDPRYQAFRERLNLPPAAR